MSQINCGVTAGIAPFIKDTVLPLGTAITFTSTSTNATSYKWLIDGFNTFISNTPWNYGVTTGVHKISLVASNGTCTDTSETVYIFCAGIPHNIDTMFLANYGLVDTHEYGTCMDDAPDAGFILGGYGIRYNGSHRGFVTKITERGCIEWTREFDQDQVSFVFASPDTSYYVTSFGCLVKFNKDGTKLWQKSWASYAGGNRVSIEKMVADSSGNLYALANNPWPGYSLMKLDTSGNILWKRNLRIGSVYTESMLMNGLTMVKGKLFVSGMANPALANSFNFLSRINTSNGQPEWQYKYATTGGFNFNYAAAYDSLVMISGPESGKAAIALIDVEGNFVKGIRVPLGNGAPAGSVRAEADSNRKIFLYQFWYETLSLQPGFALHSYLMKVDTSQNKSWGMEYTTYPRGSFVATALNKHSSWAALGDDFGKVEDATFASRDFRFIKIDSLVTDPNYCFYRMDNFSVVPFTATRANLQWTIDTVVNITPAPAGGLNVSETFFTSRYSCPDFIDSCNFIKVSGPKNGCSFSDVFTYKIHRNRKCALIPTWDLPPGAVVVSQTDSSVSLKFPAYGIYSVGAKLKSCSVMKDSVIFSLRPKTYIPLNLGADTTICPSTTIRLSASKKFLGYVWQDGSTDSTFTVSQPGVYWVQVIDSCGNPVRDSITITPFSIPFSIGPNRVKCNNDTIVLSAPAGFINYTWSNNYNISSVSAQVVTVNPQSDTSYFVRAEKLPGCYLYDTVQITVFHSPPVNLGADKSFCTGDSAVFDAGAGFANYIWNNGATSQTFVTKTTGIFRVIATTSQGCRSFDTVEVKNVFPLPQLSLNKDPRLCIGDSRTLDPGTYRSYLWQDGSVSRTFTARVVGVYRVSVTDNNGCKGEDSTAITTMLPLPANFLPNDTSMCSFGTLQLMPLYNYPSYTWSTGSATNLITIKKPGAYWLIVKDTNNCKGTDTVLVNDKNCLKGLYVPTAFTPNHDGKNDVLHALIFGNVKQFRFTIFNRWGQIIFETTNPAIGWDGTVAEKQEDTGVYLWTCNYQFAGENVVAEKGTVLLLR
jgi:gliding motility-associated-like protein